MKKIIVLLSLIVTNILNGQVTFLKGYMIPVKGDTLKGEIKVNPKKEQDNHNKVFFKDASSGVQKNYKPEKVKGYGFENNHYVAIKYDDETKFYKRICDGDILFYKVAFEINSAKETTYDFDYFLYKAGDKKLTNVKQNKFKKQLQEWMVGQADLANDFKDEKNFNEQSAAEVINKYNEWKKAN